MERNALIDVLILIFIYVQIIGMLLNGFDIKTSVSLSRSLVICKL